MGITHAVGLGVSMLTDKIPGKWTQLAKGPTVIANETTVSVATVSGVADGEVVVAFVSVRTDTDLNVFQNYTNPAGVVPDVAVYSITKTTTADEHELLIRHDAGLTVTFDWVLYKVVPE